MLLKAFETLFVLLLVAGVPVLSWTSTRGREIRKLPRSALYFSAAVSQWLLAGLGTTVMLATSRSFHATGFRSIAPRPLIQWTVLLAVVSLAAIGLFLVLERWGWWPAEPELVYLLIPETLLERLWAVLVLAPTAAFCEEYLYRGYLLGLLIQVFHSGAWGVLISSLFFGLAHIYQGASGVMRAGLLGAFLAYPLLRFGSLYPSMAAHFLIDTLVLGWLGPAFMRRRPSVYGS